MGACDKSYTMPYGPKNAFDAWLLPIGHLRSSCPEPPKTWEADFNKGKTAFWGPKLKQSRPQWVPSEVTSLRGPSYHMDLLLVSDAGRTIALDTCSEVSIGSFEVLQGVRLAENQVFIQGIGGTQFLEFEGDFLLANNRKITVFAVNRCNLPPQADILLGIEDLRVLSVSYIITLYTTRGVRCVLQ